MNFFGFGRPQNEDEFSSSGSEDYSGSSSSGEDESQSQSNRQEESEVSTDQIEAEIRQLYSVGTQVQVLETMYDPALVARVIANIDEEIEAVRRQSRASVTEYSQEQMEAVRASMVDNSLSSHHPDDAVEETKQSPTPEHDPLPKITEESRGVRGPDRSPDNSRGTADRNREESITSRETLHLDRDGSRSRSASTGGRSFFSVGGFSEEERKDTSFSQRSRAYIIQGKPSQYADDTDRQASHRGSEGGEAQDYGDRDQREGDRDRQYHEQTDTERSESRRDDHGQYSSDSRERDRDRSDSYRSHTDEPSYSYNEGDVSFSQGEGGQSYPQRQLFTESYTQNEGDRSRSNTTDERSHSQRASHHSTGDRSRSLPDRDRSNSHSQGRASYSQSPYEGDRSYSQTEADPSYTERDTSQSQSYPSEESHTHATYSERETARGDAQREDDVDQGHDSSTPRTPSGSEHIERDHILRSPSPVLSRTRSYEEHKGENYDDLELTNTPSPLTDSESPPKSSPDSSPLESFPDTSNKDSPDSKPPTSSPESTPPKPSPESTPPKESTETSPDDSTRPKTSPESSTPKESSPESKNTPAAATTRTPIPPPSPLNRPTKRVDSDSERTRGVIKIPTVFEDDVSSVTSGSDGEDAERSDTMSQSDTLGGDSMHVQPRLSDRIEVSLPNKSSTVAMTSHHRRSYDPDSSGTSMSKMSNRRRSYEPGSSHSRSRSSHSVRNSSSDPSSQHSRGSVFGMIGALLGQNTAESEEAKMEKLEKLHKFAAEKDIREMLAKGMDPDVLEDFYDLDDILRVQEKMQEEENFLRLAESLAQGSDDPETQTTLAQTDIPTELSIVQENSKEDLSDDDDVGRNETIMLPVHEQILELHNKGTTREMLESIFHPEEVAHVLGKTEGKDDTRSRSSNSSKSSEASDTSVDDQTTLSEFNLKLMKRRKRLSMIEETEEGTEADMSRRESESSRMRIEEGERLLSSRSVLSESTRRSLPPTEESEEPMGSDAGSQGGDPHLASLSVDEGGDKQKVKHVRDQILDLYNGGTKRSFLEAIFHPEEVAAAIDGVRVQGGSDQQSQSSKSSDQSSSDEEKDAFVSLAKKKRLSMIVEMEDATETEHDGSQRHLRVRGLQAIDEDLSSSHVSESEAAKLSPSTLEDGYLRNSDEASTLPHDSNISREGSKLAVKPVREQILELYNSGKKREILEAIFHPEDVASALDSPKSGESESLSSKSSRSSVGGDDESGSDDDESFVRLARKKRLSMIVETEDGTERDGTERDASTSQRGTGLRMEVIDEDQDRNASEVGGQLEASRSSREEELPGATAHSDESSSVPTVKLIHEHNEDEKSLGTEDRLIREDQTNDKGEPEAAELSPVDLSPQTSNDEGEDRVGELKAVAGMSDSQRLSDSQSSGSFLQNSLRNLFSRETEEENTQGSGGESKEIVNMLQSSFGSLQASRVRGRRPSQQEAKEAAALMNDEADIRGLLSAGTKMEVLDEMYEPDLVRKVVEKMEAEEALLRLLDGSNPDGHEVEDTEAAERDNALRAIGSFPDRSFATSGSVSSGSTTSLARRDEALQDRLDSLLAENEKLRQTNASLVETEQLLQQERKSFQATLEANSNDMVKAQLKLIALEQELSTAKQEHNNVAVENESLRQDNAQMKQKIEFTDKEIAELLSANAHSNARLEEYTQKLAEVDKLATTEVLQNLKNELEVVRSTSVALQGEKDRAVEGLREAKKELEALEAELGSKQKVIPLAVTGNPKALADLQLALDAKDDQLASLQARCTSLESELAMASKGPIQASRSIPTPEESAEVQAGNASSVNHDPLYGPRVPDEIPPEEKGKGLKKKFVSKDQRLKTLEASVEEQDVQLQKTLVEMEILNTEKRELERKLKSQDEELQQILDELETQGLVSTAIPSVANRDGILDAYSGSGGTGGEEVKTSKSTPVAAGSGGHGDSGGSDSSDSEKEGEKVFASSSIPRGDPNDRKGDLDSQLTDLKTKLEQAKTEKARLEEQLKEFANVQAARSELEEQMMSSEALVNSLKATVKNLEEQSAAVEDERVALQKDANELKAERNVLARENKESLSQLKAMEQKYAELEDARFAVASKLDEVKKELQSLQQRYTELETEREGAAKQLNVLEGGVSVLQREKDEALQKLAAQSGRLVVVEEENAKLQTHTKMMEEQLQTAQEELKELKNSRTSTEQQLKEAEAELASAHSRLSELQVSFEAELRDSKKSIVDLKRLLNEVSMQRDLVVKQLAQSRQQALEEQGAKEAAEADLMDAREQIETLLGSLEVSKSAALDSQAILNKALEEASTMKTDRDTTLRKLDDALHNLEVLEKDNVNLRSKASDDSRNIESLTEKLRAANDQLEQMAQARGSLEDELLKAADELQLSEKKAEMEASTLLRRLQASEDSKHDVEDARVALDKNLQELTNRYEKLRLEAEELAGSKDEALASASEANTKLVAAENANAQLRQQQTSAEEKLQAMSRSLEDIEKRLAVAEESRDSLDLQLADSRNNVLALKSTKDDLNEASKRILALEASNRDLLESRATAEEQLRISMEKLDDAWATTKHLEEEKDEEAKKLEEASRVVTDLRAQVVQLEGDVEELQEIRGHLLAQIKNEVESDHELDTSDDETRTRTIPKPIDEPSQHQAQVEWLLSIPDAYAPSAKTFSWEDFRAPERQEDEQPKHVAESLHPWQQHELNQQQNRIALEKQIRALQAEAEATQITIKTALADLQLALDAKDDQLASLQARCTSLESELAMTNKGPIQASRSIPTPEESAEVQAGNASSVSHDPLYGPRVPDEIPPEEKGKGLKKKFVSKDQRLKTLEASVEEQDVQLQKTLVEMEILNTEKRELERKLKSQDEELQQILDELETQGLVSTAIPSVANREGMLVEALAAGQSITKTAEEEEVETSRSVPRAAATGGQGDHDDSDSSHSASDDRSGLYSQGSEHSGHHFDDGSSQGSAADSYSSGSRSYSGTDSEGVEQSRSESSSAGSVGSQSHPLSHSGTEGEGVEQSRSLPRSVGSGSQSSRGVGQDTETLEKELMELKTLLEETEKEKAKLLSQIEDQQHLKQTREELEEKMRSSEAIVDSLRQMVARLEEESNVFDEERESLQGEIDNLRIGREELAAQIDGSAETVEGLEKTVQSLQEEKSTKEGLLEEVNKKLESLESRLSELTESNQALEEKLQGANGTVAAITQERDYVLAQATDEASKVASLEATLIEVKNELERAMDEKAALQSKLAAMEEVGPTTPDEPDYGAVPRQAATEAIGSDSGSEAHSGPAGEEVETSRSVPRAAATGGQDDHDDSDSSHSASDDRSGHYSQGPEHSGHNFDDESSQGSAADSYSSGSRSYSGTDSEGVEQSRSESSSAGSVGSQSQPLSHSGTEGEGVEQSRSLPRSVGSGSQSSRGVGQDTETLEKELMELKTLLEETEKEKAKLLSQIEDQQHLKQTREELEEKMRSSEAIVDSLRQMVARLEEESNVFDEERESLQGEIDNLRIEREELAAQIDGSAETVEGLEKTVQSLQEEKSTKEGLLEEVNKKLESLESRLSELTESNQALEEKLQGANGTVAAITQERDYVLAQATDEASKVANLEATLIEVKNELERALDEKAALQSKLAAMEEVGPTTPDEPDYGAVPRQAATEAIGSDSGSEAHSGPAGEEVETSRSIPRAAATGGQDDHDDSDSSHSASDDRSGHYSQGPEHSGHNFDDESSQGSAADSYSSGSRSYSGTDSEGVEQSRSESSSAGSVGSQSQPLSHSGTEGEGVEQSRSLPRSVGSGSQSSRGVGQDTETLEKELMELKTLLEETEKEKAKLLSQIEDQQHLKQTREELEEKMRSSEAIVDSLRQMVARLEEESNVFDEERESLQGEIDNLRIEREELAAQIDGSAETVEGLEKTVQSLQEEKSTKEGLLEEVNMKLESLESRLSELTESNQALEEKLQGANGTVAAITQERDDGLGKMAEQDKEASFKDALILEHQLKIQALEDEQFKLHEERESLQREMFKIQTEKEELATEQEGSTAAVEGLEKAVQSLQEEKSAKEGLLEEVRKKLESLESKFSELAETNLALEEKLQISNDAVAAIAQERDGVLRKMVEQDREASLKDVLIFEHEGKVQAFEAEQSMLSKSNLALAKRVENLNDTLSKITQEKDDALAAARELERTTASIVAKFEASQQRLAALEEKLRNANDAVGVLTGERDNALVQLAATRSELAVVNDKLIVIETENEKAGQERDRAVEQLLGSAKTVESLEGELLDLKARNEVERSANAFRFETNQRHLAHATEETARAKADLEAALQKGLMLDTQNTEMIELKLAREEAVKQRQEAGEMLRTLKAEKIGLEDENLQLREELKELRLTKERLQNLQVESNKMEMSEHRLRQELRRSQDQLQELQIQIKSLKAINQKAQDEAKRLQAELDLAQRLVVEEENKDEGARTVRELALNVLQRADQQHQQLHPSMGQSAGSQSMLLSRILEKEVDELKSSKAALEQQLMEMQTLRKIEGVQPETNVEEPQQQPRAAIEELDSGSAPNNLVQALEQQVVVLQQQLEEAQQKTSAVQNERDEALASVEELAAKLEDLESSVKQLPRGPMEESESVGAPSHPLSETTSNLVRDPQQQVLVLQQQLEEAQEKTSEVQNERDEALASVEELAAKLEDLESSVKLLPRAPMEESESVGARSHALSETTSNLVRDLQQQVANLQPQLEEAQEKTSEVQKERDEALASVEELAAKLEDLESSVKLLPRAPMEESESVGAPSHPLSETTSNLVRDLQQQVANLQQQLEEAQEKTSEVQNERDEALASVEELAAKLEDLESSVKLLPRAPMEESESVGARSHALSETTSNLVRDLQQQVANLQQQLEEAQEKTSEVQNERDEALASVEELAAKLEDLESSVKLLPRAPMEESESVGARSHALSETTSNLVRDLQQQVANLQQQLDEAQQSTVAAQNLRAMAADEVPDQRTDAETERAALKLLAAASEEKLEIATRDVENLQEERAAMQRSIETLEGQVRKGKIEVKEAEDEKAIAESELQKVTRRANELMEDLAGVSAAKERLEEDARHAQDEIRTLARDRDDARSSLSAAIERLKTLRSEAAEVEEQRDNLLGQLQSSEDANLDLQDRCRLLASELKEALDVLREMDQARDVDKTEHGSTVTELRGEIKELREKLKYLEAETSSPSQEVENMRVQLEDSDAEKERLQVQLRLSLEELAEAMSAMETLKSSLTADQEQLARKLDESLASQKGLEDLVSRYRGMLPQLEAELLDAREKHSLTGRESSEKHLKLLGDLQTLKLENNTLQDNLELAKAELQSSRATVDECNGVIAKLTADLSDAMNERDNIGERQSQTEKKLMDEMKAFEAERDEYKAGLERVTNELEEALEANLGATDLQTVLSEHERKIFQLENELLSSTAQNAELGNKIESLEALVDQYRKQISALELELSTAAIDAEKARALEPLVAQYRDRVSSLEEQVSLLQTPVATSASSLARAATENLQLVVAERDELVAEVTNLQSALDETRYAFSDLKASLLEELDYLGETTAKTQEDVETRLAALQMELAASQRQKEDALAASETLCSELEQSRQSESRLSEHNTRLEQDNERKLAEIMDLTEQNGRFKQLAESLTTENTTLTTRQSEHEKGVLDVEELEREKATLKEKVEGLEQDYTELDAANNQLKRLLKERVDALREENRRAEEDNQRLQMSLSEARLDISTLREQRDDRSTELSRLEANLRASQRDNTELQKKLIKANQEKEAKNASLHRKNKKLETSRLENKQLKEKLEQQELKLEEAMIARDSASGSLKTKESLLADLRRQKQEECDAKDEKIETLNKAVQAAERETREKLRRVQEVEAKVSQLEADMVEKQEEHRRENEALKTQVSLLGNRSEGLRESLAAASARRDKLEQQLKEAESEITRFQEKDVKQRLESEKLSKKIEQLDQDVLSLSAERTDLRKELVRVRGQFRQALTAKTRVESALQGATQKLVKFQQAMRDVVNSSNGGATSTSDDPVDLLQEVMSIVDKAKITRDEAITAGVELENALVESNEYCENLRKAVEEKNDKLIELRSSFMQEKKQLMGELLELEGVVGQVASESMATNGQLRGKLNATTKEAEKIRNELTAARDEAEMIADELKKSKKAQEKLQEANEKLKASVSESKEKVKQLKESQALAQKERQELEESLQETVATADKLREKQVASEKEYEALRDANQSMQDSLKQAVEQLQKLDSEKQALHKFVNEIIQERDDTMKLKDLLQRSLQEAKQSVGNLRESVARLDSAIEVPGGDTLKRASADQQSLQARIATPSRQSVDDVDKFFGAGERDGLEATRQQIANGLNDGASEGQALALLRSTPSETVDSPRAEKRQKVSASVSFHAPPSSSSDNRGVDGRRSVPEIPRVSAVVETSRSLPSRGETDEGANDMETSPTPPPTQSPIRRGKREESRRQDSTSPVMREADDPREATGEQAKGIGFGSTPAQQQTPPLQFRRSSLQRALGSTPGNEALLEPRPSVPRPSKAGSRATDKASYVQQRLARSTAKAAPKSQLARRGKSETSAIDPWYRMSAEEPRGRALYGSAPSQHRMADDRRRQFDPEVFDSPFYNASGQQPRSSRPARFRAPTSRARPQRSPAATAPSSSFPPVRPRSQRQPATPLQSSSRSDRRRPETRPLRDLPQQPPPRPRRADPNPVTVILESICDPPDREIRDVSGEYQDVWESPRTRLDRVRMKAR